jgi:integrase
VSAYKEKGKTTWLYEFVVMGQRYRQKGFPTKKLAEHAEEVEKTLVKTQGHEALYGSVGPKLMTWDDALKKYRLEKKGVGTQDMILARIGWWAEWGKQHGAHYIQAMSREIIESGLTHLASTPGQGHGAPYRKTLSPQTVKHYKAQLHAFYEKAHNVWGCISRNPVKQLDKPIHVPKFKARILSIDERRRLLAGAEPHMKKVILFGLFTGLREMAIMRLDAEDFQVKPGWLRAWDYKPVRHGGQPEEYLIPLAPELQKIVRELGVVKGRIWRWPDGSIIHRWQRASWLRTLEAAGFMRQIPITRPARAAGTPGPKPREYRLKPTLRFHDVRHMVGVALAEAGYDERVIQAFMHHASREASRIYTSWVPERTLAAAGAKLAAAHNTED